jgi:hypothetical protein
VPFGPKKLSFGSLEEIWFQERSFGRREGRLGHRKGVLVRVKEIWSLGGDFGPLEDSVVEP